MNVIWWKLTSTYNKGTVHCLSSVNILVGLFSTLKIKVYQNISVSFFCGDVKPRIWSYRPFVYICKMCSPKSINRTTSSKTLYVLLHSCVLPPPPRLLCYARGLNRARFIQLYLLRLEGWILGFQRASHMFHCSDWVRAENCFEDSDVVHFQFL